MPDIPASVPVLALPFGDAPRRTQWPEDLAGGRHMDCHHSEVHHPGYGHPRLIAALKAQLDELPFAPRHFTDGPAVALADKLAGIAPDGLSKVLLAPGGLQAIEMALKLARAVTGRHKTISLPDSFTAPVSAGRASAARRYPVPAGRPLLAGTEHVAPFACHRCPYAIPIRPAARAVPDALCQLGPPPDP